MIDFYVVPPDITAQLFPNGSARCANPECGKPITPGSSQLEYVFQDYLDHIDNIIQLCPECAANPGIHSAGKSALQAWKIFHLALTGQMASRPADMKFAAVRNFYSIAKYIPDKYYPFPFSGGEIYLNIHESHMMLARALGIYEPDKTRVIQKLLKPGMTFIDIGANKGDFSLIAARQTGSTGTVLAFEPEPENCNWFSCSIRKNGYTNIRVFQIALSDTTASATLYLGEKSGWHSIVPQARKSPGQQLEVDSDKLDNIIETGQYRADIIKIDVEGGEIGVLNGAVNTMINNKRLVLLIDIHPHLGVNPSDVADILHGNGYVLREMKPPHAVIHKPGPDTTEILALHDT